MTNYRRLPKPDWLLLLRIFATLTLAFLGWTAYTLYITLVGLTVDMWEATKQGYVVGGAAALFFGTWFAAAKLEQMYDMDPINEAEEEDIELQRLKPPQTQARRRRKQSEPPPIYTNAWEYESQTPLYFD